LYFLDLEPVCFFEWIYIYIYIYIYPVWIQLLLTRTSCSYSPNAGKNQFWPLSDRLRFILSCVTKGGHNCWWPLIEGTTGFEKNKEPPVKVKSLVHKLLDTLEISVKSPCLHPAFGPPFFFSEGGGGGGPTTADPTETIKPPFTPPNPSFSGICKVRKFY
jgi:hypothetical protein